MNAASAHTSVVEIDLPDAEATRGLGRQLSNALAGGEVLLLSGPLGAGKTTLVQGLADGLELAQRMTSPSFVLVREAPGRGDRPGLVHVDLYRLEPGEAGALGLDDLVNPGVVIAIEWPERYPELLEWNALLVTLERHEQGRRARLEWRGQAERTGLPGLLTAG